MSQESSFGRYVRQRRRELDLTQDELARRVGCAAITIRKIEADAARPSVQIAERLAMALGIPLDDRAEFVRRAREAHPEPPPTYATPSPALAEIGAEDLSGRAIRGYALGERIGAGGFGAVYRATQPLVEREVAVKIILPAFANHPDFIRRFEAEAQLVARLEHPHIVPLYDYWREPGVAFLVMRLLRGGSVQALLTNGALPLTTITRLLEQICVALHSAHRIGVIHRDLKLGNILLDEDQNAYLADFGIAKNLGNPNLEDQTQANALIGSPHYISPEQIRSLGVRPQTDIYCLGVMLYEMLTGVLPFTGPTPFDLLQQHMAAPLPSLAAHHPGLPAALDAVIGRAAAKDPADRYPDALALLDDFRHALEGRSTQTIVLPIPDDVDTRVVVNPFKGLRAFGEADTDDFFGRETLIQQLLARLSEGGELARFLAVIGPSGSGKSSVVGAGLIPALRRGGLLGSENWFYVDLMPGPHPFEELEAALLRVAVNPPVALLAQLTENERGLTRAVNRILPADEAIELVLVIDQFEELFTLVSDEAERALLLSSLVAAVLDERSRVRVVITLRADFVDRPLRYVDFGELLQRRNELVLPLTPDELERAIAGPTRRVGLRLEAGLVAAMVREVGDQPGALPLLQYALTELFEKREGNTLTKAAYAEIGGALGALGRRAEEVFASLSDDAQASARQLFLRLVTLGEGVEDTRRRALRGELESLGAMLALAPGPSPAGGGESASPSPYGRGVRGEGELLSVVETFGKARLLTFDHDLATRGPTVEVAHEALLREWPRLREWLRTSRADVRLQRQLAHAAAEWQNANRDASYLLTGAHLEQFAGWAATTTVALTGDERAFLEASVAEQEKRETTERARQRRELELQKQGANRLRYLVGAMAVFLVVALGLTAFAFNQRSQAQEQARLSTSRELAAASINNIGIDPERSILLALQAVKTTYSVDKTWTKEAEEALHRTVASAHSHHILKGHTSTVSDIAYSPDGTHLVSSSLDGTAKIWDTVTGEELLTLTPGEGGPSHGNHSGEGGNQLYTVAFSPDGKQVAAAGQDGIVTLWEATTGAILFTLEDVNPTQAISATTNEISSTQSISVTAIVAIAAIDFSPDGQRLAAASEDGTTRVWDLTTKEVVLNLFVSLSRPPDIGVLMNSVAFSPDGSRLATAGSDNTAQLWDATTGEALLALWESP